ncbi:MAG: hypothetical protein GY928_14695 [Colwellia sp.]|nr:hypothetical protein [Colwellia sp.]
MILCTHVLAENNAKGSDILESYEIINTVMRIRVEYPPTHEGKLKLWDDYLNSFLTNKELVLRN